MRHLTAKTKRFMGFITKTLFTDDHALKAYDKNDLRVIPVRLCTVTKLLGLMNSLGRAEGFFQKTPDTVETHAYPTFESDGTAFTYC